MFFKTIAILISVCFVLIAGNDKKEQGRKGDSDNTRRGMWYQPPVIKRQAMDDEDRYRQAYFRMQEEADAVKDYYNQMPVPLARSDPETRDNSPIPVIFIPGLRMSGKEEEQRFGDYTPRPGRGLPVGYRVTPLDQEIYRMKERMDRSPYYPRPRPARTEFFPRLSREMSNYEIPEGYKYIRLKV